MAQIISINGPILFMLAFGQHYLPNHTKNAFIKAFIADMANIYHINFKNIKLEKYCLLLQTNFTRYHC